MLTTKQRAFLRAKATALDTTFQIGKGGVSENMLKSIEDALTAHEMVKIKCLENCEYTPKEALEGISEALEAEQVQVIGNKFVLFKISPEHRKYDLEALCEIENKKEEKKKPQQKPAGRAPYGRGAEKPQGKPQNGAKPQRKQSGAKPQGKRGGYKIIKNEK